MGMVPVNKVKGIDPDAKVPTIVIKEEPANGEAPILLYEIVFANDPSYAPPGTSPVPVFV